MKSIPVTFRLSPEEFVLLKKLGNSDGYENISEWLRVHIRHEFVKRHWPAQDEPLVRTAFRIGRPLSNAS